MKKYLVTTAIDYTNDVIHIGHAYQKIVADVLARAHRALGDEVFFVTGTDEHGQNVERAAAAHQKSPKEWCDEIAKKDREQLDSLNISYDRFIRTTDLDHEETSLWFYNQVLKNGDIYPGSYTGFYCEPCEAYKTLSDLKNGKCDLHPSLEPKRVIEKNYYFRWSKYSPFLKDFLQTHPNFILPPARKNEMLAFLDRGLEDIPVTRQNITWGFKVPNDENQVLYVWFDALINYFTAAKKVGFWDKETFIIHVIGKDNTRWHTLLWPAMLKSAGLRLPNVALNHGFLNLEGKKISKTLGNVIRPTELTQKYGCDTVRYYLLRYGPLLDDADLSLKRLEQIYNSDLANSLGNLVARVAKLCETSGLEFPVDQTPGVAARPRFHPTIARHLKNYRIDLALQDFFDGKIKKINRVVDENKPWTLEGPKLQKVLTQLVADLRLVAFNLSPFLPTTAEKIKEQFSGPKIQSGPALFPRI